MEFTKDEYEITKIFKETKPWTGNYEEKVSKWQTWISNLCEINKIPVPNLVFAKNNIQSAMISPKYAVSPENVILMPRFSVQMLLPIFCHYRETHQNGGQCSECTGECIEYSVGLFFSVWPSKISECHPCKDKDEHWMKVVSGLNTAMELNPEYQKEIEFCDCHNHSSEEDENPLSNLMNNTMGGSMLVHAFNLDELGENPSMQDFMDKITGLTSGKKSKKNVPMTAIHRNKISKDKLPEEKFDEEVWKSWPGNMNPELN